MLVSSHKRLELIKNLYYERKLDAPDVAKRLGVSLNTVYRLMQKNGLARRSLVEMNRLRFEKKPPSFAVKEKLSFTEEQLKLAGVMLYWGEGFNSPNAAVVDFANSKPEMIALFVSFLRRICGIDESKLRCFLYCYSNQNPSQLIKFWSQVTGIPKRQFTKPYVRKDFDLKKKGKMEYGLLHIRYGDKKLLNIIRGWIKEYAERLQR